MSYGDIHLFMYNHTVNIDGPEEFYTSRFDRENSEEIARISHQFDNSSEGNSKYILPARDETSQLMLNQRKTNMRALECDVCGKSFRYLKNLRRHATAHADNKPYSCDTCSKKFSQKHSLKVHLKIHMRGKPYKCTECGQCFEFSSLLKTHVKTHINICDRDASPKVCVCDICGKLFRFRSHLTRHLLTHSGEKPFICDTCGKSFTLKDHLRVHMKSHSEERPHSCEECGASFRLGSSLYAHKRRHKGDKPFLCMDCGKRFITSRDLKVIVVSSIGRNSLLLKHCIFTFVGVSYTTFIFFFFF